MTEKEDAIVEETLDDLLKLMENNHQLFFQAYRSLPLDIYKEIENNTSAGLNETNITKNLTGDNTPEYKEEEISSFTTKIVTKDSSKQKNISITCSTLNDTLVENGAEFSFCNTVGPATTAKGYEEADIFDANRKKEKRSWWW